MESKQKKINFDPNFHLPNSAMDAWVIEIQQLNPNLVESINFALIIKLNARTLDQFICHDSILRSF